MSKLRFGKVLLVALTGLCILQAAFLAHAGHYNNQGVYVGTPSSAVTNLCTQFPNGGDAMAIAIATLLEGNPSLAADVANCAATSGNLAQQTAAGKGMGLATLYFINAGNATAAAQIAGAAQASGNDAIITAAIASSGGTLTNVTGVVVATRPMCTGSSC
jgi:hypothetical protein